jgi:hypothetical protein
MNRRAGSRYVEAHNAGIDAWQVFDVLDSELEDTEPVACIVAGNGGYEVCIAGSRNIVSYFPTLDAAISALEAGVIVICTDGGSDAPCSIT